MRRPASGISLGATLVTLGVALSAKAEPGAVDPEVVRRSNDVAHASGPAVYGALHALIDLWDLSDPSQVEAALVSASESRSLSPDAQVYAKILVAEARKRRGDTPGSAEIAGKLGFVNRWIFVGPFDNKQKTGLSRAFQPEQELDQAIVPGAAYDGKERPIRFRDAPGELGLVFDFGAFVRPREEGCGYASTFLTKKPGTHATKVSLWVGAEGAFKLWKGSDLVLQDEAYRDFDFDRSAALTSLDDGVTRITIKVCSDAVSPRFALRLGDETGAPLVGVDATSDPAVWADEVAKRKDKKAPQKQAASVGTLEGPIQAFERATSEKGAKGSASKPSAAMLDAYARYLVTTGGDPKGEHHARDLAERAADAEPTVERLLFAGELAEGRNQTRAWLDKAEAKLATEKPGAGTDRDEVDVLLAKARLARSGFAWRDAVPFFDAVLDKEPDNVVALLGRVDLYAKADLPRTALATLAHAVEAHPRSVVLLHTYGLELRAVGHDAEADDVDARWFAYRADDPTYITAKLDRATLQRDEKSAEHWLARFLAAEPDAAFGQAAAARTYRALGHADRARRALESALEMAPDDQSTLRALADLAGEEGQRDEELRLLKKILALYPQAKDVREYVAHIEPQKAREDEAYAWDKDKLLAKKANPPKGYPKRTIRDLTVTTIYPNGLASHFHQVAFQPLTDEGAAQARQYAFGYQGDKQQVELRVARVYRADGSVAEAIESGEAAANDPSIAMYTSERNFYVQFPRLQPGDVVELRYRVDDIAVTNDVAGSFGEVEYMQSDDPIASREYVVIAPKSRPLSTYVGGMPLSPKGGITSDVTEKGSDRVYHFEADDVAALTPEPEMPPFSEVAGQVHVSTFSSWDELGKFYWDLARDQFDVDDEVRRKVKEITAGAKDDASKVKAIYKYVTELRYVGLEFGIEGIKPRRCALSLARGWGDCKDKATMIVTMLREAGIASTIVIVRSGMRGDLAKSAPANIAAFDHAIAYVPSLDLYLDGTADGAGAPDLPTKDRNSVALQINEGKPKLVHLPDPPPEDSPQNRTVDVTLANDGSASVVFESTIQGANAIAWRERYHAEGSRRDRAEHDLAGFVGPLELAKGPGDFVVKDVDDVEKPVGIFARAKATTYARKDGDTLSVPVATSPNFVGSLGSLSTRTQDVIVGAQTVTTDQRTIHIPAGMKVVSLPEAKRIDTPFGKVELTVESQPGKVVVKTSLTLSKSRVHPDEYPAFRTFCQNVDNALNERLVLAPQ